MSTCVIFGTFTKVKAYVCDSLSNQSKMTFEKNEKVQLLQVPIMENNNSKLCNGIREGIQHFQGIIYAFLSGLFVAFTGIIIKYLERYSIAYITFSRFLTITIFSLPPLVLCRNTKFRDLNYKHLPACSLCMFATLFLRYLSYEKLPLGEAQVIAFSNIIFTAILGRVFLEEKLTRLTVIAVSTSIFGLLLIAKLPEIIISRLNSNEIDHTQSLIGLAYGLVSSLSATSSFIFMRKLKEVDISLVTFLVNFFNTVIAIPVLAALEPITLAKNCDWMPLGILLIGLLGYSSNVTTIKGVQTTNISAFSVVRMGTDLAVAFSAQVMVFGEPLTCYNGFGTLFVVIGALIPPFQKWILLMPENHAFKSKIHFLLK